MTRICQIFYLHRLLLPQPVNTKFIAKCSLLIQHNFSCYVINYGCFTGVILPLIYVTSGDLINSSTGSTYQTWDLNRGIESSSSTITEIEHDSNSASLNIDTTPKRLKRKSSCESTEDIVIERRRRNSGKYNNAIGTHMDESICINTW